MVTEVVLPQMGLEVSEGTVTAILVAVGDTVSEGQTVAEVETDKAIAEIPATRDGVVVAVEIQVEDVVPVGATLMRIADSAEEVAGAARDAQLDAEAAADVEAAAGDVTSAGPATQETAQVALAGSGAGTDSGSFTADGSGRRRAAPIARRAAERLGVALELITGTGPAGRITLGDVERAAETGAAASGSAAAPVAPSASAPGERLEPLSATRQAIARRLGESQLVPQYTLTRDVDATWLLAEKARLSAAGPARVGVVDLLLAALAETLGRHPQLAASFVPGGEGEPPCFRHPDGIDLGLAVASERGLLVPVIRDAHRRTLPELVLERARLVEVTRAGRLGRADMGGAAASLSSLGTFGVDSFTAMLNPGESSILAVGRTVERVVPRDRGLAVVPTLTLTFTFDHRVVDGAVGAAALAELAELLEGAMEWRL
ncbi:MAG: dihydrolipoamide acetyltransferase family protein [Solirubrobacterales bacterium]